jgi:hypothetical protein
VEDASIPAPSTEIDHKGLDALRNAPIKLIEIAYEWFEEQKKRDIERVYPKMSAEEKETVKRRMAEINKVGTSDKESTPPSLTPMWIRSRVASCHLWYHFCAFQSIYAGVNCGQTSTRQN